MDRTDAQLLEEIAGIHEIPIGAYNIRKNGGAMSRNSTANIEIVSKTDNPGIDIIVKPGTVNESVHIPVILTQSGLKDIVYNDFYIGENADVLIVAGCGIHNAGDEDSQHDGIHTFHIGKNAKIRYIEKHYGEGAGKGSRVLNPKTVVIQEENSVCEMEMVQIRGVNSTVRDTVADLAAGAKMIVTERLLTDADQFAESVITVNLNGEDAVAQISSRSVAKDDSKQEFKYFAVGNDKCRAHVQCDSIIMDNAVVSSIPAITANSADAQIIHEAAIGRINNDQLLKLMTFGMNEEEAEEEIINGFLK